MGFHTGVLLLGVCLDHSVTCKTFANAHLTHLHLSKSRGHELIFQLSCTQNHQVLKFLQRFCNASFTVI